MLHKVHIIKKLDSLEKARSEYCAIYEEQVGKTDEVLNDLLAKRDMTSDIEQFS